MEQAELLTLIEKCRTSDPQAQEKLVIETQNRVFYHCKKFLKNEQDALDATQDVLITMITSLDKLREPAAFWGWLNGITANRCKHLLTQGTKEWQIPEDEEGNSMLDGIETLDDQTVPDKAIDNAETQRLVMDIIDNLPAEQRMTVTFFYYDEMSVKDIAAAMDVSEGTVKSRLNYARKAIKGEVEKLEKKDGTKLYSVSILPFLAYFFRRNAQSQTLPPAAAATLTQGTLAATGTTAAIATAATATAGAGTATAAAVGAKATAGVSVKVIAAVLAGTLAVGGIGTVAYVSTHREPEATPTPTAVPAAVVGTPAPAETPTSTPEVTVEPSEEPSVTPEPTEEPTPTVEPSEEPTPTPTPTPTPEPTPTPAYAESYAAKVEELGSGYQFALVYIDGDSTPELVAVKGGYQMDIYTYANGQLYTVTKGLTASRLGFPSYYPRKNIILEQWSSMAGDHMELSETYYQIDANHQMSQFCTRSGDDYMDGSAANWTSTGTPPNEADLSGTAVTLVASLSSQAAILEQLG